MFSKKKKGSQSESFSEGNVAANNFHTAIILRKAVSTTTFACFRDAPDKVSRRTVLEPLRYNMYKKIVHGYRTSCAKKD